MGSFMFGEIKDGLIFDVKAINAIVSIFPNLEKVSFSGGTQFEYTKNNTKFIFLGREEDLSRKNLTIDYSSNVIHINEKQQIGDNLSNGNDRDNDCDFGKPSYSDGRKSKIGLQ